MSLEQLTGTQMDVYERVWTRVMLASGATLMTALGVMYVFWSDGMNMFVCGTVAVASIVILSIAAAKLRELERGLNESDREERGNMHSALEGLDD
jgi:multisubunit Na+/H+ antiporter MnhG subunit